MVNITSTIVSVRITKHIQVRIVIRLFCTKMCTTKSLHTVSYKYTYTLCELLYIKVYLYTYTVLSNAKTITVSCSNKPPFVVPLNLMLWVAVKELFIHAQGLLYEEILILYVLRIITYTVVLIQRNQHT